MIKGFSFPIPELFIKQPLGEKKDKFSLFSKNEVFDAKVLKVISPSRAEMLIAGKKVIADTTLPLKKGDLLQLRLTDQNKLQVVKPFQNVEKTIQPLFPLISSFSKQGGLLKGLQKFADIFFQAKEKNVPQSYVSSSIQRKGVLKNQEIFTRTRRLKPGDLMTDHRKSETVFNKTQFATIKKLFLSVALKSENPDHQFLPKLIEKSGLMWESKLNNLIKNDSFFTKAAGMGKLDDARKMIQDDLKGGALNFLKASDGDGGDVLESFKGFAENIEKFQMLNNSLSDSGKYLIPFPIFSHDMMQFGQIFIDTGDEKRGKNTGEEGILKVSFLLNMTRLGALRADFSFLKQNITGVFYVSDDATSIFIKNMIPELSQRLKKHDYLVSSIDCRVVPSETLSETSLIEDIIKDEPKGLSLVV